MPEYKPQTRRPLRRCRWLLCAAHVSTYDKVPFFDQPGYSGLCLGAVVQEIDDCAGQADGQDSRDSALPVARNAGNKIQSFPQGICQDQVEDYAKSNPRIRSFSRHGEILARDILVFKPAPIQTVTAPGQPRAGRYISRALLPVRGETWPCRPGCISDRHRRRWGPRLPKRR